MFLGSRTMTQANSRWNGALALVLAAVAGFVDVIGFLTLHELFTAHMTGNTSRLGIALGHGDPWAALPFATAALLFMAGVAAGTVVVDAGRRWAALAAEACLVAGFMGYGAAVIRHGIAPDHSARGFYVLAALATVALGIQTAALTRVQRSTVRTSYISGVLTNLARAAVRRLTRGKRGGHAGLLAGVSLCYLAGATAAAYGRSAVGIWCLAVPVAALAGAASVDRALQARPRTAAAPVARGRAGYLKR
jgi:uncharacterized membrane protein YoaK (UPF0700 family)